MPFGEQESDGAADQLWEVADDEPGVFAGEFDLAAERQVIAHEHTGSGDDAGGERLVVVVPQAEHPAVVIAGFLGVEFHQAEAALAFMRQRVCLGADAQVGGGQCLLDRGDELVMRDGAPAWVWRGVETARTSSRSTCEAPQWSVRFGARRWMSLG
jgi:hypothetical protein